MLTRIILITPEKDRLAELAAGMESRKAAIDWAASGQSALKALAGTAPDLVVVDDNLSDMSGLAFIEKLVTVNAMINTALVSCLDEKQYHEKTEGLGILMQLRDSPDKAIAHRLMDHLDRIRGIAA